MNPIKTSELYYDLQERLGHALEQKRVNNDLFRKLDSRPRIFFAMNEALKYFVGQADIPLNAISSFVPQKAYELQAISTENNLTRYAWPQAANEVRRDGGLLRLTLDGKVLEPVLDLDPVAINRRLISLQNQVNNSLMYGSGHQNALVDLPASRIYIPSGITSPTADIVERPDRIATVNQAKGKFVLIVTGGATANGTITVTNTTAGKSVTPSVIDGDTPAQVAAKIAAAVDASSAMAMSVVLFSDEVRLYTADEGAAAAIAATVSAGATGVTFNSTSFNLTPAETAEIPIDQTHLDTIAVAAFEHMINNVAFIGSRSAAPPQTEETES